MSNSFDLSTISEVLYAAKSRVCNEPTGFLQSIVVNSDIAGVSFGGTVTSHRAQNVTVNSSITPAMTIPAADDTTAPVADSLTIGQTANIRIPIKGEDLRKLDNTTGRSVLDNTLTNAIRQLRNTIEAHVASVYYKASSRATGTAGTTPFASNMNILADLRQILEDNGCPFDDGDLSLVLSTSAATKLRQLSNLYKANEGDGNALLRRGELLNLMGMSIKTSAQVQSHTKGTGTSYQTNGAVALSGRAITVDTGTGTIVAGDIITHADDSVNKYVVNSALASNVVTIGYPGLKIAVADNKAITVGNDYTANLAFHRTAGELVMRPPLQPTGGDAAIDRMVIADSVTGLVFEAGMYAGYKMNMLDITTYYQAKVWQPEFVATLLG